MEILKSVYKFDAAALKFCCIKKNQLQKSLRIRRPNCDPFDPHRAKTTRKSSDHPVHHTNVFSAD